MKELGITKGDWEVTPSVDYSNRILIHPTPTFGENKANAKLIADAGTTANKCGMLPSELLERYNEAIEVLENVKRLETLIRYPDDVSIMHEGEAKAIHMMLNDVEQTISKAKVE